MAAYMFGISRIDSKNTHCWWVRLGHIKTHPQINKPFSDRKYGGIEKAFIAAVEFRDRFLSQYPPKEIIRRPSKEEQWKRRKTALNKGMRRVVVGTGPAAVKKARELGVSKVTCWRIRSGRQNFVQLHNLGGKKLAEELLDAPWKNEVTHDMVLAVRDMVASRVREWSEDEISDCALMAIKYYMRSDLSDKDEHYLEKLTVKIIQIYRKQKRSHSRPLSLDIEGNIERFSDSGKVNGWGSQSV